MLHLITASVTVTILAAWLGLSILNQIRPAWIRSVKRFDIFSAIPIFTFFAPRPGISDWHILYRDKLVDDTVTDWRELLPLPTLTWRKLIIRLFLNPVKRERKIASDMCAFMMRTGPPLKKSKRMLIHLPYLWIALAVAAKPRPVLSIQRQWVFASATRNNVDVAAKPQYLSPFHNL